MNLNLGESSDVRVVELAEFLQSREGTLNGDSHVVEFTPLLCGTRNLAESSIVVSDLEIDSVTKSISASVILTGWTFRSGPRTAILEGASLLIVAAKPHRLTARVTLSHPP